MYFLSLIKQRASEEKRLSVSSVVNIKTLLKFSKKCHKLGDFSETR